MASSETPPASATLSSTLLEGLRASQPSAWRRLVHLFTPLVYRWCRGWGVPRKDEDDVVQEVFTGVWGSIGGYRGRDQGGGSFRGWLRTVTRRKVANLYHKGKRHPKPAASDSEERRLLDLEATDASFDDAAEIAALYQRALQLISGEFTPRTLDIFQRTTVDGQSAGEVAAALELSTGAVYQAKHRVMTRLREELRGLVE